MTGPSMAAEPSTARTPPSHRVVANARGAKRVGVKQPGEADRHAEAGEHVEDPEDGDVAPVQELVPHLPAHDAERQEGHDADGPGRDAVERLVLGRLNVVRAWL